MIGRKYMLLSEASELRRLIATTPDENVIERLSLQRRLEAAEFALARAEDERDSLKTRLTFTGSQVVGRHGIYAEFGAKAAAAFSDAFAVVLAAMRDRLSDMGPIPSKSRNQLLITGTAVGSFGFEFELPSRQGDLFSDSDESEDAVEKIQKLFYLTSKGSDDEIADIVSEIHPRAVKKIASFLDLMDSNNTVCRIEFKDRSVSFENIDDLRNSKSRISDENIREETNFFYGRLQGVLPQKRRFELEISDTGEVIEGKIAPAIIDPDALNREFLHKSVKMSLSVVRVGQGKPRYTLSETPLLHENASHH